MNKKPTPESILQLGLGFWASKTLLSAVELGLFTELARESADLDDLTERLGLHPRGARDFFDALVSLGMLERRGGRYSNTAQTDLYLDRAKDTYIGGMLEVASLRLYRDWGSLTEALRTGRPQNETNEDLYFLYRDPEGLKKYFQAMTGLSLEANKVIAKKFPWQDYRSFVDVGAAQGGLAVQIALANPHVTGAGFDLAPAGPIFEEYVASFGLSDRLRFHPGDFFKDPLPRADVLSMGHILHDWNLEEKKDLIAKAFRALPDGGALIIYESIIDDERRHNTFGLLMSLHMLIQFPGGFDYTGADCCEWLREAGFTQTRVEHLTGPDSMVIGIK